MSDYKTSLPERLLADNEYQALKKIKVGVFDMFEMERMILFGSVVRGEADEESDIDLLLVAKRRLSRRERHRITDAVCEINLEYVTNFSTLVVDYHTWDKGLMSFLNIHEEVQREGVAV